MDRTRSRDDRDDPRSRRGRDDEDRGGRRSRDDDDRGGRSSGGRRSGYQYEARSSDSMRKRATQGANEFDKFLSDKIKMFKPNDGDNTIRILPPTWEKPKHYGLDIYVHYGVGPDRQSYLCLHKMKGEACPICEERQIALNEGDDAYAKQIEPKRRVLVYLIDRDHEKEGLQAWAMPWTVDRDLCTVSVDKKSGEVLPIDHPDEGFDVMFEKKGQKDRTEYIGMQIARRDSRLGDDAWLNAAMELPLPEALVYFEYDHIAKAFGGGGSHREKGRGREDDDERPSRGQDRDDERPRGRNRDEDDRPSRRRRDEDEAPAKPLLTWDQVHALEGEALDEIVEDHKLKLNPANFNSDEELADAICEELGIEKTSPRRRVVEDEGRDRLAAMRERRRGD